MIEMKNLQLLAEIDGTAVRGLDLIMKVGTTAIGGQKSAKVSMKSDVLDVSTKTSGDWKRNISGAKEWSATCEGFYYVDDAGYDSAVAAFLSSAEVDIILANTDSSVGFKGKALITSLDIDTPYDDAMSYSIELTGTGALTDIASA